MKLLAYVAAVAFTLAALLSCATYNRGALEAAANVAVVSITCDRLIDTSQVEALKGIARQWAKSEDMDFGPAAERLRASVFNLLAPPLPFRPVEERTVLESEGYQHLRTEATVLASEKGVAQPQGYVAVPLQDKASLQKLMAALPDADAFMWVKASYALAQTNQFKGFIFVKMRAVIEVTIIDRSGRAILRNVELAEQEGDFRFTTAGAIRDSDLMPPAIQATEKATAEIARWIEAHERR